MRTFVISDIHGNNELFRQALKKINFRKVDRLIILGDLIDRGVDSKGVLDTIILLLESGFKIDCLLGNHEQMFLDATTNFNDLNKWLVNGGDKTLFSFLTNSIEKISPKYFDLIKGFKHFLEVETYIFVHAALNMCIDQPFSDLNTILWERDDRKFYDPIWLNNRQLIHGHNPESESDIINTIKKKEPIICIDNGVYMNRPGYGKLCVLELECMKLNFFQ